MNLFEINDLKKNLAFVHQVIVASERLLEEAYTESKDEELKEYFLSHLKEEANHAQWLKEDLAGFSIGLNATAVSMAGSQYYLIKHVHPACLLGYMLALEKPIAMELVDELEKTHGKPILRTLRIHAENDPAHYADLLRQIEKQPPELRVLIEQNRAWTQAQIASYQG